MGEQVAIRFSGVSHSFKERMALRNVSIEIAEGEFVAIMGANGSGKSTLAKHINALLLPSEGKVEIFGMDTSSPKSLLDIRKSIGYLQQNPQSQFVATIVEDDVAFGPENIGMEREAIGTAVHDALETVGMLDFAQRDSSQLSGGEMQRIALAGTLAMRPRILVLDEPTAMLDPLNRQRVLGIVRDLSQSGITIVLITHSVEEARLANRIVCMSGGEVAIDSSTEELLAAPERIAGIGLDLPFGAQVAHELERLGVSLDGHPLEQKIGELLWR